MSDTTKRKKPNMIRIGIGILTVLLVVFIVILMQLVSNIQGTARVVNYAGLIRGETQRIIKLENSGQREDELIKEVQSFIEGLRHGNDQLKLVRLKDDDFQDKMKELDEYFISLHKEIYRVRTVGYEHTDIISKSERFFKICDEATGLAEVYAQRKATSLATLEKFITADIVVLMLLIGYEFIKAVRFAAMNRILRHKAYLDNATGLPNKNKCEEILGELNPQRILSYAVLTLIISVGSTIVWGMMQEMRIFIGLLFVCDLPYHRNILSEDLGETNLSQCCRGLINKR